MSANRSVITPADPYPPNEHFRIRDYRYVDHLSLVRYNARPTGSDPAADWQLAEHYAVEIDIDYRNAGGTRVEECWRIEAPQGLYTDLSSVPAFGRWIVSKVGAHLEASIIHDYLYLKWTDARLGDARLSDWVFADECLRAGMRQLGEFSWFQRFVVNFAVGTVGWFVFRRKSARFSEDLARWQRHLDYLPHTPVPPEDHANHDRWSWWTQGYFTLTVLVFAAMILMGVNWMFDWSGPGEFGAAIRFLAWLAENFLLVSTVAIGVVLTIGVGVYLALRLIIGFRRSPN